MATKLIPHLTDEGRRLLATRSDQNFLLMQIKVRGQETVALRVCPPNDPHSYISAGVTKEVSDKKEATINVLGGGIIKLVHSTEAKISATGTSKYPAANPQAVRDVLRLSYPNINVGV